MIIIWFLLVGWPGAMLSTGRLSPDYLQTVTSALGIAIGQFFVHTWFDDVYSFDGIHKP